MNSNSSNNGTVAVTDSLNDKVVALIVVLTGNNDLFSAYDLTARLRTDPANKGMNIPHNDVRDMVLEEYRNTFCDDYDRTLVKLTCGDDTYIYHPDNVDATEYHLAVKTDTTATTTSTPTTDPAVSSTDTDLTVEKKLNIPKSVLVKLGLSAGKKVRVDSDNGVISLTEVTSSPEKTMFVASDGRLRLCQTTLTEAFGTLPDRYDISVTPDQTTIEVKPRP